MLEIVFVLANFYPARNKPHPFLRSLLSLRLSEWICDLGSLRVPSCPLWSAYLRCFQRKTGDRSSPVSIVGNFNAKGRNAYPCRPLLPAPTLICFGLASARLPKVIFRTPLS